MAVFDQTVLDYGIPGGLSDSRPPTIVVEDPSQQKIHVFDGIASGNVTITGFTTGHDYRYSVYDYNLAPLSRSANNGLNPWTTYAKVAGGSASFFRSIPVQMLFANATMACGGLVANGFGTRDYYNTAAPADFAGYMYTLNNWNRSMVREKPATKHYYYPLTQESWMTVPVGNTARTVAQEIDVSTNVYKFVPGNLYGITGGILPAANISGSSTTSSPFWATHNLDFFDYDSSCNRLYGVTVRSGGAQNVSYLKSQPGAGTIAFIPGAFGGATPLTSIYYVATTGFQTGRDNVARGEAEPAFLFVGPKNPLTSGDKTQYLFVHVRSSNATIGLVNVVSNTASWNSANTYGCSNVTFTTTPGSFANWWGSPSMMFKRVGDPLTKTRFIMSEPADASAGRRMKEYIIDFTANDVVGGSLVTPGNSVTFTAAGGWDPPVGTSNIVRPVGYYATISTYMPGNSLSEYFFTHIPIDVWSRPSQFLPTSGTMKFGTCYLTNNNIGIEMVPSDNSYCPSEPPIAVYPVDDNHTMILVLYYSYAEFLSINGKGIWQKTSTYHYPLRTVSRDQFGRVWAYDANMRIHILYPSRTVTASLDLASKTYDYSGSIISTYGNLNAYDTLGSRISANVQVQLSGGGMRFSDNTVVKTIQTSSSADTNVALQIVGPGPSNIRLYL